LNEKLKFLQFALLLVFLTAINSFGQKQHKYFHTIAAIEEGQFMGWPANNGVWVWDNEILVGFTKVEYDDTEGHNIKADARRYSLLTRSTDGGRTWHYYDPENYVGDGGGKTRLTEPIDFTNENFAMRIEGDTYHGNDDDEGALFYSYDRGVSWKGPFYLGDIAEQKRFEGYLITPRTDYIVTGRNECLIMITSRVAGTGMSDKISVINTTDGGLTFNLFCPWVVSCSDPYRAAMPSTVRVSENEYVLAARRRVIANGDSCWIDCYKSDDGAKNWYFLSRVSGTGDHNGNPPALARLNDGRVCCVYGNRKTKQILGKYSDDNGKTWGEEFIVRDDFYTGEKGDLKDLGYCRLIRNAYGELVAMYYWASKENKQQHIAVTIWKP
jgi:hypothetical protein